jgi:hypothetical protein
MEYYDEVLQFVQIRVIRGEPNVNIPFGNKYFKIKFPI